MFPDSLSIWSPVPKRKAYLMALVAEAIICIAPEPSPLGLLSFEPTTEITTFRLVGALLESESPELHEMANKRDNIDILKMLIFTIW